MAGAGPPGEVLDVAPDDAERLVPRGLAEPLMGIYATPAQVRDYCQDSGVTVPEDDADVERLIARAEREVDLVLGPYVRLTTGRKLDPATLSQTARDTTERRAFKAALVATREEWRAAYNREPTHISKILARVVLERDEPRERSPLLLVA